ncbi:DUF1295 domain-containing protein [Streptomyces sp. NBC_01190]|uniref:DUF1295 domain-containing protein n=1 Tax=Streptomyces sp. NBC_01190 TaxID=2903767 RepID=UPI0038645E4A|nr:DUF1295 domain-containing protein [Streptomyces sp. NBC_01190]
MSGYPWAAFAVNLGCAAGAALVVMLVAFAVGVARSLHRVVDIAWGLAFAAVAAVSYGVSAGHGDDGRRLLVLLATLVWGLRLATHIGYRGRGRGEDPRYKRMLDKAPHGHRASYALRVVYLRQGALVWLISLPVQAACYIRGPIDTAARAGAAVWAAGLVFEAVGDRQLVRFTSDPANHGRIMDRGLWSWTRHPNYFGDFLVWWGLFLMACGAWQSVVVSLVSPLLMSFLLTLGSGKRLLEQHMADRPGFTAYKARTSGFFPLPPRRGA